MIECRQADELAGAYALDAVEAPEAREVSEHLRTCPEPHDEVRAAMGAAMLLAETADPVTPSPELRERLMVSIARIPQERAVGPAATALRDAPTRDARTSVPRTGVGWPNLARWMTVGGAAASLFLAIVAGGLWLRLQDRESTLRDTAAALAGAESAYRVEGTAGSGYVVETPGAGAMLILAGVDEPPAGRIYELWLIGDDGVPVAAGTLTSAADEITVVPVEQDLAGFGTFAVTIEDRRVEAPSGDPILAADLEG